MEKTNIKNRIEQLRNKIELYGFDAYLILSTDYHNSEYVPEFFRFREYITGFTGSNGTVVVTKDKIGLWTDGRYFVQAKEELRNTEIMLFPIGKEGVETVEEYLVEQLNAGQTLGFCGKLVNCSFGLRIEKALTKKGIIINDCIDLSKEIWINRPALPQGKVIILPNESTGETVTSKCKRVREILKKVEAKGLFLSKLDDIMWLFNIRGSDIACNPVALSYCYVTLEKAYLFLQEQIITKKLMDYANMMEFHILPYERAFEFCERLQSDGLLMIDKQQISYGIYQMLKKNNQCLNNMNPTTQLKAVKNDVEQAKIKEIYLKDSVVVTKFIFWLKQNIGKMNITEKSAGLYMDQLRKTIPEFVDFSFPTICAYKENAAMMHYEASEFSSKKLCKEGMLLIDSGGQYFTGTTDVTRTIVLGNISKEIKRHYTAVVKGLLHLLDTTFLKGCTGRNLDIMARQYLWNMNIDYKCGTGHGVGCMLHVHEGPHNIRYAYDRERIEGVFEEGVVVTNEPGVYVEGSHGIRVENVMLCKNSTKNLDGQFLSFETLTLVPLDPNGILPEDMSNEDMIRFRNYQQLVYHEISPHLTEEECRWLKKEITL